MDNITIEERLVGATTMSKDESHFKVSSDSITTETPTDMSTTDISTTAELKNVSTASPLDSVTVNGTEDINYETEIITEIHYEYETMEIDLINLSETAQPMKEEEHYATLFNYDYEFSNDTEEYTGTPKTYLEVIEPHDAYHNNLSYNIPAPFQVQVFPETTTEPVLLYTYHKKQLTASTTSSSEKKLRFGRFVFLLHSGGNRSRLPNLFIFVLISLCFYHIITHLSQYILNSN